MDNDIRHNVRHSNLSWRGSIYDAASHASSTFTKSDISQSFEVTPAAIAGVTFKVW